MSGFYFPVKVGAFSKAKLKPKKYSGSVKVTGVNKKTKTVTVSSQGITAPVNTGKTNYAQKNVQSFSTLGDMLLKRYVQDFLGQMQGDPVVEGEIGTLLLYHSGPGIEHYLDLPAIKNQFLPCRHGLVYPLVCMEVLHPHPACHVSGLAKGRFYGLLGNAATFLANSPSHGLTEVFPDLVGMHHELEVVYVSYLKFLCIMGYLVYLSFNSLGRSGI